MLSPTIGLSRSVLSKAIRGKVLGFLGSIFLSLLDFYYSREWGGDLLPRLLPPPKKGPSASLSVEAEGHLLFNLSCSCLS